MLARGPRRFGVATTTALIVANANNARSIRQHADPFAMKYALPPLQLFAPNECEHPPALFDWATAFADSTLPTHIDIGSHDGQWLQAVAAANTSPPMNRLGLEIRHSLALKAAAMARANPSLNLAFLSTNLLVSHPHWMAAKRGGIDLVSINFPDPNFKFYQHKRRIVTHASVGLFAHYLAPGGRLVQQTDVRALHEFTTAVLDVSPLFDRLPDPKAPLLGVPTPREVYASGEGASIYRCAYERNHERAWLPTDFTPLAGGDSCAAAILAPPALRSLPPHVLLKAEEQRRLRGPAAH